MKTTKAITVKCYAGYKGEERPTSFSLEGRTHLVVKIADRWYDIDYSCFKVVADDGAIHLTARPHPRHSETKRHYIHEINFS